MTGQGTPPEGEGTGGRWPAWMKPVVQIVVAVIAALAIAVLTPAGDWMREQLFPTNADVSGSAIVDGRPASDAHLILDGEDVGTTNEQGAFLLEGVDDGKHTLTLETASPLAEGDITFSVQQRATEVTLGAITLSPLLELGYVAEIQPGLGSFQYDITLWIRGDAEVMDGIDFVRYALPAPLSGSVRRRNGAKAFCYRSAGELSVLEATTGDGSASADVHLRNGESFQILAEKPGQDLPPSCRVSQTGAPSGGGGQSGGGGGQTGGGGGPNGEPGGGGNVLILTADPSGALSFDTTELIAAAGEVTIELVNDSGIPHNVEVVGNGVEEVSETITSGSTDLVLMLAPGTYDFYCAVPGHREAGMEGTLTVQ